MNKNQYGFSLIKFLAIIFVIYVIILLLLPKIESVVEGINESTIETMLSNKEKMVALEMIQNQSYVETLEKLSQNEFDNVISSRGLTNKTWEIITEVEGDELYIIPNDRKLLFGKDTGLILVNKEGEVFYYKQLSN